MNGNKVWGALLMLSGTFAVASTGYHAMPQNLSIEPVDWQQCEAKADREACLAVVKNHTIKPFTVQITPSSCGEEPSEPITLNALESKTLEVKKVKQGGQVFLRVYQPVDGKIINYDVPFKGENK